MNTPSILPQPDSEVYRTDSDEDDESPVYVTDFGDVNFWNDDVSNELSEIVGSRSEYLEEE